MKTIKHIEPCVCGEMPIIKTHNCLRGKVEYCASCPKCGRGDTFFYQTNFTTYQALKEWNKIMTDLKTPFEFKENSDV